MASENVIELSDATFEDQIAGDTPTLVDFWAEWCAPCRRIAPIVEEIAGEMDGKLKVGKVNIDQHQDAANKHGVQSIPTLILFKNGQVVDKIVGAHPKDTLVELIQKAL